MNKNEIAAATIAVSAGFALGRHLKNRRLAKKQITESRKEIRASFTAFAATLEGIHQGKFSNNDEVQTAFEFERIAARFND